MNYYAYTHGLRILPIRILSYYSRELCMYYNTDLTEFYIFYDNNNEM